MEFFSFTEERWSALTSASEGQRKSLESLVDKLREFSDIHDQLVAWLIQKDRMITALGTLASEPNLAKSQLQQVQVSTRQLFLISYLANFTIYYCTKYKKMYLYFSEFFEEFQFICFLITNSLTVFFFGHFDKAEMTR